MWFGPEGRRREGFAVESSTSERRTLPPRMVGIFTVLAWISRQLRRERSTKIMPELPEVETMRRGICATVGSRVADVEKIRCRCKPIAISPGQAAFRRRVRGATVTELGRAGKRVVVWLDTEEAVVIEPRMTGLVLVVDPPRGFYSRRRNLSQRPE